MRIGITGHQRLTGDSAWSWVEQAIGGLLDRQPRPVVGVTCLAVGADQIFARLVLERGGDLYVVVPFPGYERSFQEQHGREEYKRLLGRASEVETLPPQATDEESYFAAGKRVVDLSEVMLAVWNGEEAAGLGGTGDVVAYALTHGRRIHHINPVTKETSELTQSSHGGAPGS